jgi:hypothetical protein
MSGMPWVHIMQCWQLCARLSHCTALACRTVGKSGSDWVTTCCYPAATVALTACVSRSSAHCRSVCLTFRPLLLQLHAHRVQVLLHHANRVLVPLTAASACQQTGHCHSCTCNSTRYVTFRARNPRLHLRAHMHRQRCSPGNDGLRGSWQKPESLHIWTSSDVLHKQPRAY